MDGWSARGRVLATVVGLSAAVAAFAGFTAAAAQSPAPSQLPLCPSAFNLVGFPIDAASRPRLESTWVEAERALRLDWNTGAGANCAFFQVQDHAGGYSGVGDMAWADFITAPGASARLRGYSTAGKRCFRLFAISNRGRSEPVESCAEIPADAVRTPNPPGVDPQPSSTPWPPPSAARLEGHVLLLDENSFPLPPGQQAWFAGVSWDVLPGFTGRFEIQRAQVRRGEPLLWSPLPSGQIPVSLAAGNRINIEEWVGTGSTWCFRVRTVTNSPTGVETGPFSQEVCQQMPPSSGGNGPATLTPSPVPLPPVAGNSAGTAASSIWLFRAAATLAAALIAAAAVASRARR